MRPGAVRSEMFRGSYADVYAGTSAGAPSRCRGDTYAWTPLRPT